MRSALAAIELYGAAGSGSIAVEAALTLLRVPYTLIEGATWAHESARERVAPVNAMRQVPTLIFPDGEIMTESAAILIDLADRHPAAGLCAHARRPAPPAIPALDGLRLVRHLLAALDQARRHSHRRARRLPRRGGRGRARAHRLLLANMDAQITPSRYLLGDELTVLDLYVTVVSRFGPWRKRFYAAAPKMTPVVKRVDAEPRLAEFWARRYPFDDGWE
jgi:GST-like protein